MKKLFLILLLLASCSSTKYAEANVLTSYVMPGIALYGGAKTTYEHGLYLFAYCYQKIAQKKVHFSELSDNCVGDNKANRVLSEIRNYWMEYEVDDECQYRISRIDFNTFDVLIGIGVLYCGYAQLGQ